MHTACPAPLSSQPQKQPLLGTHNCQYRASPTTFTPLGPRTAGQRDVSAQMKAPEDVHKAELEVAFPGLCEPEGPVHCLSISWSCRMREATSPLASSTPGAESPGTFSSSSGWHLGSPGRSHHPPSPGACGVVI